MFHPLGPQSPSVYWRRRLVLLASIVVLIMLVVLTFDAMRSNGSGAPAAGGTTTSTARPSTTAPVSSTSTRRPSPSSTSARPTTSSRSATTAPSKPAATCQPQNLGILAVVGKTNYKIGDQPLLQMQVTNNAATPCVQNLADKEVELRVYNGESRVWGSHDCKVEPGTTNRTLAPRTPVRVAISWSGLSSQPKCAGTRQRVGAGTYTLYPVLAGKTGKATQFTIS
jgi:hypothetical protein